MNINKKIKFIIPFLALILIFGIALACNGGSKASSTTEKTEEALIEEEITSKGTVEEPEETRVTMGPWRVLKDASEVTLYLELPPGYKIDHTSQTQEGGPLLYMRGPATEHQEVWRKKGRGIFVGVYSVPNPEQMSLQQLLEKKIQKLHQQFEEPEYMVESLEDGITKINGYDAYYAFNIFKDMKALDIYGYPLTACDLDIFICLDDYHPSLPGGDLYLLIKSDFWEMQYPEMDVPVLREDLNYIFHSLQIEV